MSQIESWLVSVGWNDFRIEVASNDASFRSYYRMFMGDKAIL